METYKENFIVRMQRLQNELPELDTPVSFENIIQDAINNIRHFYMDINGVNISKERDETIEELLSIRKMVVTELMKNKDNSENAILLTERIARLINDAIEKFIIFISIL